MLGTIITAFKEITQCYEEFQKNKTLKEAVREQLIAELHFNCEVLDEVIRSNSSKDESKRMNMPLITGVLETVVFDSLQSSCIPIRFLFEGERSKVPIAKKYWEDAKNKEGFKNFNKWSENLTTHSELVTRIYHRIKIVRALNNVNISKNISSIRYLRWLMVYHKQYSK